MRTARTACVLISSLLAVASAQAQDDPWAEDVRAAERHLEKGQISRARALFDDVLADAEDGATDGPSADVVRACRRGLMEIDLRGGSYAAVVGAFDALDGGERARPEFRHLVALAAMRRGDHARAEAVLRALTDADPDDFAARFRLGELLDETGRRAEARAGFEAAVDRSRRASVRDPVALTWVARCHIALGGRDAFEAASGLLVEAIRLAPQLADAHVAYGWLRFLAYGEWSGASSGERALKRVLEEHGEHEDALLALFRIRKSNHLLDGAQTESYLDRALAANPSSVPALVERGIGYVDDRRFEDGIDVFDRALRVNPNHRRALAERAAAAFLSGDQDGFASFAERARRGDAGYGGVELALGDHLVALYRFADAVPLYRRALEIDAESVDAMHGLAKALVYSARGEEAARLLEKARSLQPGFVNPWRNNVLAVQSLLAEEYVRVERDGFTFLLHRDDREVLEEYLVPYHAEARAVLGAKYGYTASEPVRVEVFRTWDDFSVRTIGFRGFTALGACFGPMITLVSPVDGDLRRNDFMWSATVWHEYAHVLTLWLSKHRVPRWLTEGISVYEERVRDKSWERGMERELFDAYHNSDIPPVRLMNRLFRGPRILFGYYQGGLVVELVARDFGFDKVVEMLRRFGEDRSTQQVFESVLGIPTEEFDRRLLAFVREKIAPLSLVPNHDDRKVAAMLDSVARDPADVATHVALAWAHLRRGVEVDAAHHLRQALRQDPDDAAAHLVHAELLRRRGAVDDAIAAYERGFAGADDFDSRIGYGALLQERGDVDGAARQFLAAKRCWPSCTDQAVAPELLLARLYRANDRDTDAMMELQAYCRKTARAFRPRIELAAYARAAGDRRQEAELLEQALQIDPFTRSLHVDLGECYVALGRGADAVREFEMALAVAPAMDRAYMDDRANAPRSDAPEYLEAQAEVRVRLARVLYELGRVESARASLERAASESPSGAAGASARQLLDEWRDRR